MAGRFLCLYVGTVARAGARRARGGDQAQAPDAAVVQESHGDGRQIGKAGSSLERHQCTERGQEARGGGSAAQTAPAGGGVVSDGNSADAGSCVTIAFHAAAQRRGKRRAERRADRRAPQKRRTARKARRAGRALQTGGKAAE